MHFRRYSIGNGFHLIHNSIPANRQRFKILTSSTLTRRPHVDNEKFHWHHYDKIKYLLVQARAQHGNIIAVIIVFVCDFFLTRPMELVELVWIQPWLWMFDPVTSAAFQNHDIPLMSSYTRKVRISVKGVKIVLLVALETKKGLLSRILF